MLLKTSLVVKLILTTTLERMSYLSSLCVSCGHSHKWSDRHTLVCSHAAREILKVPWDTRDLTGSRNLQLHHNSAPARSLPNTAFPWFDRLLAHLTSLFVIFGWKCCLTGVFWILKRHYAEHDDFCALFPEMHSKNTFNNSEIVGRNASSSKETTLKEISVSNNQVNNSTFPSQRLDIF